MSCHLRAVRRHSTLKYEDGGLSTCNSMLWRSTVIGVKTLLDRQKGMVHGEKVDVEEHVEESSRSSCYLPEADKRGNCDC